MGGRRHVANTMYEKLDLELAFRAPLGAGKDLIVISLLSAARPTEERYGVDLL